MKHKQLGHIETPDDPNWNGKAVAWSLLFMGVMSMMVGMWFGMAGGLGMCAAHGSATHLLLNAEFSRGASAPSAGTPGCARQDNGETK